MSIENSLERITEALEETNRILREFLDGAKRREARSPAPSHEVVTAKADAEAPVPLPEPALTQSLPREELVKRVKALGFDVPKGTKDTTLVKCLNGDTQVLPRSAPDSEAPAITPPPGLPAEPESAEAPDPLGDLSPAPSAEEPTMTYEEGLNIVRAHYDRGVQGDADKLKSALAPFGITQFCQLNEAPGTVIRQVVTAYLESKKNGN